MEISNPKEYTLITSNEISFDEFHAAFSEQKQGNVTNHKIIQLSDNLNTTADNLLLFLSVANEHRSNGISFVVICNGIDTVSYTHLTLPTIYSV